MNAAADSLTHLSEKPYVTFFVLAYNQEQFIREAVHGALSQDYSNLEIIFSDDCSTDRTFEIIEHEVSRYHGPHNIIVNKNTKNLGITEHVNSIVARSNGELLIAAAGDDISLPTRTSELVKYWISEKRTPCSIYSNTVIMNEDGQDLFVCHPKGYITAAKSVEDAVSRASAGIAGCSHAFSKHVFEVFGPLHREGMVEDHAIGFRSLLLGGIHYLPSPLVRYREVSSSVKKWPRNRLCDIEIKYLAGWQCDLRVALTKGLIDQERSEAIDFAIQKQLEMRRLEKRYHTSGAMRALFELAKQNDWPINRWQNMRAFYKAFAPWWLKRFHKFLSYDVIHPRDGFKNLLHLRLKMKPTPNY